MNRVVTTKLLDLAARWPAYLEVGHQSMVIHRGDMRAVLTAIAELQKHGILQKGGQQTMSDDQKNDAPETEVPSADSDSSASKGAESIETSEPANAE